MDIYSVKYISRSLTATKRITLAGLLLHFSFRDIALLRKCSSATLKNHATSIWYRLHRETDGPTKLGILQTRIRLLAINGVKKELSLSEVEISLSEVLSGIAPNSPQTDKIHIEAAKKTLHYIIQEKTPEEILGYLSKDEHFNNIHFRLRQNDVNEYMLAIALIMFEKKCANVNLNALHKNLEKPQDQ